MNIIIQNVKNLSSNLNLLLVTLYFINKQCKLIIFMFANVSNFINEFIKKENRIGAIAPSSKFLAKKMLKEIDFSKDLNIIELGPGNGVFTEEILTKMSADSRLLAIELNQNFASLIDSKIKDKRFIISCGSATNISKIRSEESFPKADVILSSIPLAILPIKIRIQIINEIKKSMRDNGAFIQYQYSLNAKEILQKKFSTVKTTFTPLNLPPAFIYYCES